MYNAKDTTVIFR